MDKKKKKKDGWHFHADSSGSCSLSRFFGLTLSFLDNFLWHFLTQLPREVEFRRINTEEASTKPTHLKIHELNPGTVFTVGFKVE